MKEIGSVRSWVTTIDILNHKLVISHLFSGNWSAKSVWSGPGQSKRGGWCGRHFDEPIVTPLHVVMKYYWNEREEEKREKNLPIWCHQNLIVMNPQVISEQTDDSPHPSDHAASSETNQMCERLCKWQNSDRSNNHSGTLLCDYVQSKAVTWEREKVYRTRL